MTKKVSVLTKYLFPAVLLLLPLWNVWTGIDVADTGYSLSYYRFFPDLSGMWFFSTFLSNFTGWLLMHLPGGAYLLGMNVYTSLLVSGTALAVYFVLAKRVPAFVVFAGEVITILLCWCPTVILYHYLSYIFFSLGALLLFEGLCSGKRKFLFGAGVLLGVNAFVRTPSNCLEVLLIVVVWYAALLNRETIKTVWKQTLCCVTGYLAAAGLLFLLIGLFYGFDTYVQAVMEMIGSADTASDYTLAAMVVTTAKNMLEGLIWLLKLGIFFLAGIVVQYVGGKKWILPKTVVCVLLGLGGLFLLMRQGFFDRNYYYHLAVYRPFLVFVWIIVGAALFYMFYKKAEKWERIWAAVVLAVTVIMPFGTNNHLYANMNNLFVTAPFTLYAVYRLIRYAFAGKKAVCLAAGSICVAFLTVFGIQCAGYGVCFVLFDNYEQIPRDTKTEGIETLQGMYTYSENAAELSGLQAYLKQEGLTEQELITMGSIPGLHYYLNMPCALTVIWPDLGTSSYEVFERELQGVTQEIRGGGSSPVVIVESGIGKRFAEGNPEGEKEKALWAFLFENGYEAAYGNNRYSVFQK